MLKPPRDYWDIFTLQSLSENHFERYSNVGMLPFNFGIDDLTVNKSCALNQTFGTFWHLKQPMKWTSKDVLDWVYYLVEEEKLDGSKFQGELYRSFRGRDLCLMNRKQFQQVDPVYGFKIFECFQNLCFPAFRPKNSSCVGSAFGGHIVTDYLEMDINNNLVPGETIRDGDFLESERGNLSENHIRNRGIEVFQTDSEIKVEIDNLGVYPITQEKDLLPNSSPDSSPSDPSRPRPQEFPPITPPDHLFHSLDGGRQSTQKELLTFLAKTHNDSHIFNPSRVTRNQPRWANSVSLAPSVQVTRTQSVKQHLAETSLSSMSDLSPPSCPVDAYDQGYSSEDSMSAVTFMPPLDDLPQENVFVNDIKELGINDIPRFRIMVSSPCDLKSRTDNKKNKAKSGGLLLWMFVLDLLNDPDANPKLLKWEDRDHGVFRFVQSEGVAKLWGQRKNNPAMTYEKFSRSMRFCRKAGYFQSVPKTGQFPKKLCFMFGSKSHGWRR